MLDKLVHNQTELGIWQGAGPVDKRLQIGRAAHVHTRKLDVFTAAKGAASEAVAAHSPGRTADNGTHGGRRFRGSAADGPDRGQGAARAPARSGARSPILIRSHHFARPKSSSRRTRRWRRC